MSDLVTMEVAGDGRARVGLGRRPVNALDLDLIAELGRAAEALAGDERARVVVLASDVPGVFMAGADLGMLADHWTEIGEITAALRRTLNAWERLPQPTVAAIDGHALGGGCELALVCDFRVMTRGPGRIGLPEARRGLLAAGGGTQRLVRILGRARTLDLVVRGRLLDADQAEQYGLVTLACDDLAAAVDGLVGELAALAPLTVAATKAVVLDGAELPLDEALTLEAEAMVRLASTEDALEGITSFLEKREPCFRGR